MASHADEHNDPSDPIAQVLPEHGRKSEIWNAYNLVILTSGKRKAQCKQCGTLLTAEGNSTLKRHTERSCPRLKGPEGDSSQPILDNQGQIWTFDADLNRRMTTQCVIRVGLPFGHFDNIHIKNLITQTLQPRYHPVSRQTLRRDALKMWKTCKNEMKTFFGSMANSVSLTCDVWSSPSGLPYHYICITAHWIDAETWQLVKRVITFEPFGSPHSGERLFAIIKKSLQNYNLFSKVINIGFDNASNNNNCVERLKLAMTPILDGQIFHTRCCAHIINLAVQDGLEMVKPTMDKFRLMLRRIFTKGKKMQVLYRRYCESVGFRALGPNFDMPIRWNSTYFMIDNLLRQKNYIQAFYNIHYERNTIGVMDWAVLQGLHDILGDFKNATTLLSGVYYPTSPLVLNQLYLLSSKIRDYEDNHDWATFISKIKTKLLKYFTEIPFAFTCAATLNPYLNVVGVEVLIRQICRGFGLDTDVDTEFSQQQIRKYNRNFSDLFDHYKTFYGVRSSGEGSGSGFAGSSSGSGSGSRMANLFSVVRSESSKKSRFDSGLDEFNMYMRTDFISHSNVTDFENVDLLEWWKQKQLQFPVLAAMARDILTIQASTVASESAFSLSGRIISARRTRLTPESVECCICLKDYLDSIDRIQNTTSLETEIDVVEENLEENEVAQGLSTPPTTDTDATSTSQYDDEEPDIDDLEDSEAINRYREEAYAYYH